MWIKSNIVVSVVQTGKTLVWCFYLSIFSWLFTLPLKKSTKWETPLYAIWRLFLTSVETEAKKVHNEGLRVEVGTEIVSLQRPHFITCSFIICRLHHLSAPHAPCSTLYKNCQPAGINHPLSDTPLIPVNPPCMETWWARRLNEGGWKSETLKQADTDKPASQTTTPLPWIAG